jgi:small-conductance mechanosensitive channel
VDWWDTEADAPRQTVLKGRTLNVLPPVGSTELADSSVNFVVRAWTKTPDYWPVYFDLTENIKTGLDNAGIEIPYPHMSVVVNNNDKQQ